MMDALDLSYEQIHTKWSDVVDHLDTFRDAVELANAFQDGRMIPASVKVIELGVRYGVSTVEWIKACWDFGGHLWAVDGSPPVIEPTMQYDLLAPLMDHPAWDFVLGWDDEPHVLARLPTDADIVFIDTNHTYELTTAELTEYVPRVRPGGRVFLHDTALKETANATTPQPMYPVLTAMREFCAEYGYEWTNVEYCNGLGTILVP